MPVEDLAVFTLMVDLGDPQGAGTGEGWKAWHELSSSDRASLTEVSSGLGPLKQYPSETRHYFLSHIERTLFPSSGKPGSRRLRIPSGETVSVKDPFRSGEHWLELVVDLIELYRAPATPARTFGLVHLRLRPRQEGQWSDPLFARYWLKQVHRSGSGAWGEVRVGEEAITGQWPIREVLGRLFGAEMGEIERTYYVAALAPVPAEVPQQSFESEGEKRRESVAKAWARALARNMLDLSEAAAANERDRERGRDQRIEAGPYEGYVLGRGATLSCAPLHFDGGAIRNPRSYWGEALLLGLLQQSYLEHFATRLGALGGV